MNRSRTATIADRRHALRASGTFALCLFGLLAATSTAQAQVGVEGHVVVATGAYSNDFASGRHSEFAGGGEVVFANRVGVAGELGLLGLGSRISLDGTVHLAGDKASALQPFVQAGYTRSGGERNVYHGWNAGGGLRLWLRPRLGLRVEFIEMVQHLAAWTERYHFVRFGVAFR